MYALASNLRGFKVSSLRVRITRIDGQNVFVRTADLLDAGTSLVLDRSQIALESEPVAAEPVYFHPTGLVAIG